jgi:type I pantothenate kinase
MTRKGFPESYDRLALIKFVADIKSGEPSVSAPVYSHLVYDIVAGESIEVESPDVLIIEGLNVLQPPVMGQEVALSDYFDFKIYVDAEVENVTKWFIGRFEQLREGAFTNRDDRQAAMRFAFQNAGVDCVTVGYKSPAEIDEAIENLNLALA